MKGGIYSNEKCLVCGSNFKDDGRAGLYCPHHPQCRASRFLVMFGGICKRFRSYDAAHRFLTGVRFKTDEATYDERDYRKDNPLGFSNMAQRWLHYKRGEVRPGSYQGIRWHINLSCAYFVQVNVKEIRYGHLEDFIISLPYSDKSKHNIISTLHSFYAWMKRRQEIKELPEFPSIEFELGYRKTINKATQQAIIAEVARINPNPKVAIGIRLLATYISIRPMEMLNLKEGDVDVENGYLYFPHPKEKRFKAVPLLPSDAAILKEYLTSFPAMPFFRHDPGNEKFGKKYFYKWWKVACKNLGIEGVDLYGGTRHSSVRALRSHYSPEEIKEAAMSTTNKAFERYMGRPEDDNLRSVYRKAGEIKPLDIDRGLIGKKST